MWRLHETAKIESVNWLSLRLLTRLRSCYPKPVDDDDDDDTASLSIVARGKR